VLLVPAIHGACRARRATPTPRTIRSVPESESGERGATPRHGATLRPFRRRRVGRFAGVRAAQVLGSGASLRNTHAARATTSARPRPRGEERFLAVRPELRSGSHLDGRTRSQDAPSSASRRAAPLLSEHRVVSARESGRLRHLRDRAGPPRARESVGRARSTPKARAAAKARRVAEPVADEAPPTASGRTTGGRQLSSTGKAENKPRAGVLHLHGVLLETLGGRSASRRRGGRQPPCSRRAVEEAARSQDGARRRGGRRPPSHDCAGRNGRRRPCDKQPRRARFDKPLTP